MSYFAEIIVLLIFHVQEMISEIPEFKTPIISAQSLDEHIWKEDSGILVLSFKFSYRTLPHMGGIPPYFLSQNNFLLRAATVTNLFYFSY